MKTGYVKLYRKLTDSRVFHNEGLLKVWIWCLLQANHDGSWASIRSGRNVVEAWINSGQFIFGRESAAKQLRMSPSTVWKRLKKLKTIGNCDIESNSQYSVITIVNWAIYQSNEIKGDSKGDSRVTAREQPGDTNKNDKNDKNNKNYKNLPQKDPGFAVDEVGFEVHQLTPSTNDKSYVGVIGKKKVTLKGDLFYNFERFWDAFDYRKGKAEAAGVWHQLNPDPELTEKIIQSAEREAQERPRLIANKRPKWAQGWLTSRRWEDEPTEIQPEPTFAPPPYWKEIN